MTARRFLLETYRRGRRIDRDRVPILVFLDLDDRQPATLLGAYDLLNRHLVRAARNDGANPDQWHEFEFAVYAADEEGRQVGPERFRWTLPHPLSDEEIRQWAR